MKYQIRPHWSGVGYEVFDSENLHHAALYISSKSCCEAVARECNKGDFSSLSPN